MTKVFHSICLSCLLFITFAAISKMVQAATNDTQQSLAPVEEPAEYLPDIAADAAGNLYAVWVDLHFGTADIVFAYKAVNANSWTRPTIINDVPPTVNNGDMVRQVGAPRIKVDAEGNAYVVWADSRNGMEADDFMSYDIYFAYRPVGGSWGMNIRVSDDPTNSAQFFADIAIDKNGKTYAVWSDFREGNFDIYQSEKSLTGEWEPNVKVNNDTIGLLSRQDGASIEVDDSLTAHVVWIDHDDEPFNLDISFAHKGLGQAWVESENVPNFPNSTVSGVDLAVDGDGNSYVVWSDKQNNNRVDLGDLYFTSRSSNDGSWSTGIKIDDDNGQWWQLDPSITIDNLGSLYVFWSDWRTDNPDIYFSELLNNASEWSQSRRVSDNDVAAVRASQRASVDNAGNVHVIWNDWRSGDKKIYYDTRSSVTGVWEGNTIVSTQNPIPNLNVDSDGDGLLNVWETDGITLTINGNTEFVDLPAMGANPNHKDIFVEIDYMEDDDHSHRPDEYAIGTIVSAFNFAPVPANDSDPNNGVTGIHLHVDYGANSPLIWGSASTWGALSRADALPHRTYISTCTNNRFNWDGLNSFDTLKANHFDDSRESIFHYSIWAHHLCESYGLTSGISRNNSANFFDGASDFIVSLGGWDNTDWQQAGTFMHELGHNLGLKHGGTDHEQYKPNYLSVMNYSFQTRGLIRNGLQGHFDYSRFELPALDESNLDELSGLGGAVNFGTIHYCGAGSQRVVFDSHQIDWNCDGDKSDSNVAYNINEGRIQNTRLTVLTTHNDWEIIVYIGGAIGQLGSDIDLPKTSEVIDIDRTEDIQNPTIRNQFLPIIVSE